jgi:uncharacterized surface protein with fasciclin (FAS1) repeats
MTDLVRTLKSDEPLTIFAPTNSELNNLHDRTVNTLLKTENKDQVVKFLTYLFYS